MKLSCIIIDDEPWASLLLVNFAKRVNDLIVLGTFDSTTDGFNYLKSINYEIDIVFLDVQLNQESSIMYLVETGEDRLVDIVFTSAYKSSHFQNENVRYFDWLEKPIPYLSFEKVVERIIGSKSL